MKKGSSTKFASTQLNSIARACAKKLEAKVVCVKRRVFVLFQN